MGDLRTSTSCTRVHDHDPQQKTAVGSLLGSYTVLLGPGLEEPVQCRSKLGIFVLLGMRCMWVDLSVRIRSPAVAASSDLRKEHNRG